ncbi:glyceraldehyde 3-phosphate dehydrogenase NAD-binding domain-containing protein [Pusillimonas sp. SM2304]|uniref:type I glyceraldehyde-3-phosphate dehydrogenase n=1 Tax=Pusillimonas sp. SM2304 TaxID=3073241 RepID=UPI0028758BC3|nr:glyceraldehyde 3-phosphate dehydrogenase NAD-binding domain-containing protein [Pusillimonas sp. SM2304]MDS1141582.1 glyceraldehyde 3-phosphate dehydrogenase NAD-binding domain-containing protein [Pusillimonas sp. SM2304]
MSRPLRLAINGYGRIGRCVLRALYESPLKDVFQVVAINEPADLASMAYLSQFDSTHGVFPGTVQQGPGSLVVNGRSIHVSHATEPEAVDWRAAGVDLLLECSGHYSSRGQLQRFIDAGCPRVLVSQPSNSAQDVDYTVVYGINHTGLTGQETIVSNASCTTNAIVPVLSELDAAFGVGHAFLTTLHSVMNDQPMIDGYHHSDLRRTRSAMQSIVPVATGLAQGVERLLPQLKGKVQAKAIRVPILNVSAIDLMVKLDSDVSVQKLNDMLISATRRYPGLLAYSDHPHASIDFNHNPHSAIIDISQTRTNGDGFANLFIWFDNEWGFANRMLDVAQVWSTRFQALQADAV